MSRKVLWIILLLLAFGAGYIGYDLYARFVVYSRVIGEDKVRAEEVTRNRTRLLDTLASSGVSPQQITRGFWYTYREGDGSESVYYFDVDSWAQYDLSEADLGALVSQVGQAERVDRDSMRDVPNDELPPALQFHNRLYSERKPGALQKTRESLERAYRSGEASAEELWQLSYLYELRGEYEARDAVNAASCERFGERCENSIHIEVRGSVVDLEGAPIVGARVLVLGKDGPSVETDEKGRFRLPLSVKRMEKVRLSAVKRNYSSGVTSVVVLGSGKKTYDAGAIVLSSPITIITINTATRTSEDPRAEARADGSFVITGESSRYEIPPDAIVLEERPYRGVVDIYLYEFTRETVPESLVTLDTFDEVMGYAGNLMRSFGMPFIQFFSPEGEQLDVLAQRPMLLTYKVPGMEDLRENVDDLPGGPLTDKDMRTLIAASRGDPGFPITSEFLFRNRLLSYPPFWVLDRKTGVWENIGVRVLNEEGVIEAPFYTTK